MYLRVLGLVEQAATRLAVPAQLELEATAPGLGDERARPAAEQARRWGEEGNPLVPEYPEIEPGSEASS